MIYLSGEGESGALNVKGNFHRAPHRGAGVMFGPSARSLPTRAIAHRRRDPISSSSIAGPLSERVLATECGVPDYPIRCAYGLRKAGATIAAENETTDRQSMLDVLIGTRIRRCPPERFGDLSSGQGGAWRQWRDCGDQPTTMA
jgi:hypothetical protein